MASDLPDTFRQLRTLVTEEGKLELSLKDVPMPKPGDGDIIIRVEATPINPSDLGLLVGAADLSTLKNEGSKESPKLVADVPPPAMRAMKARLGHRCGGRVFRCRAGLGGKESDRPWRRILWRIPHAECCTGHGAAGRRLGP